MIWSSFEDGRTIELISIGIVCEDGWEYYAVNSEMPIERIGQHDWLCRNVVPHLPIQHKESVLNIIKKTDASKFSQRNPLEFSLDYSETVVKPKFVIANEVRDLLLRPDLNGNNTTAPKLWAYCCAYDHVCLAQLWGTMMEMPTDLPHYTNDLANLRWMCGNPPIPKQEGITHHALHDAKYDRLVYDVLIGSGHRAYDGT